MIYAYNIREPICTVLIEADSKIEADAKMIYDYHFNPNDFQFAKESNILVVTPSTFVKYINEYLIDTINKN